MRWLLDVVFKDNLSRYRTGNGAKNMTAIRRLAFANKTKGSVKRKRKAAGWNTNFLLQILQRK
ncbi:MAG: hypothetical protein M9939_24360 [Mesorhizobium sp.]|nr:hypothetical protein [Mesorhizobium sp.]MCO5164235.1 hypothetical protein [Mesorhizobium sp.]